MSDVHPDISPELRRIAQAILDGIDPAVRAAAAAALARGIGTGRCQQMWCPVCALAALVTGDEHPLLSVIAEHSVALLAAVRAVVDDLGGDGNGASPPEPPDGPPGGGASTADDAAAKTRYQPIQVTVEE